jgi:flagellar basal-body rod modification protein FlgD
MAESMSISDLLNKPADTYSAKAPISNGTIDASSTVFTGERNSELFSTQKELDKMDFLRLLVMQLQFQDPLSPMENTDFIAQLAQFSALEGNMNIEKAIKSLDDSFKGTVQAQGYSAQSMTNASAVSLIGKQVRIVEKEVQYFAAPGETVPIRIHLGNRNEAVVEIRDGDGNVVRSLAASDKDWENSAVVDWDGKDDNGQYAARGVYQVHIQGQDTGPSLYAFVQDTVQGVRFTDSGPLAKIGGKELSISNIMDVSSSEGQSGFEGLSASSAVALLGANVRVLDNTLTFVNKGDEQVAQDMEVKVNCGNLPKVTLEIVAPSGDVVFRGSQQAGADGTATFLWDGRDMQSFDFVASGVYSVRIIEAKQDPGVYSFTEGTVDGISNITSAPQIRVNGRVVPISAIMDISNEERIQEDA